MATLFDVGLLQQFDIIFAVLLVFSMVFALLQKTKAITDSLAINSIIAVAAAFLVMLSDTLIAMIKFMIPWFFIAILFLVLLLLLFQIMGAKESQFQEWTKDSGVRWTLIGIALVIVVAAFGNVLGQDLLSVSQQTSTTVNSTTSSGVAGSSFQQNIYTTLFHPKVLGLIILFGIAVFAVALLTSG